MTAFIVVADAVDHADKTALIFSANTATQVFNPLTDTLFFNSKAAFLGVSANRLGFNWTNGSTGAPGGTAPGAQINFTFFGPLGSRTVVLDMSAFYSSSGTPLSVAPPMLLTTTNITIAGGTVFKAGDNTTGFANDTISGVINGTDSNVDGIPAPFSRRAGDTLLSFAPGDTMNGGAGDDFIWRSPSASAGSIIVNGGDGFDSFLVGSGGTPGPGATLNLRNQSGFMPTTGTNITMSSIESVRGGSNNDFITGGINNFVWLDRDSLLSQPGQFGYDFRRIQGSGGFDQISGGGTGDGSRTIADYSGVPGGLTSITMTSAAGNNGNNFENNNFRQVIKNSGSGPTQTTQTDSLTDIARVIGTGGGDLLLGGTNVRGVFGGFQEEFQGNGGADTINGGGGFDLWVSGGVAAGLGVYVNLATGKARDGTLVGTDTINGASQIGNGVYGGLSIDTLISIEGVVGTNDDDVLIGGNAGEFFLGQGGSDTIDGGEGFDTASYSTSAYAGIVADLGAGTVTEYQRASQVTGLIDLPVGTDQINSIEEIRGTDFDDIFYGGGANTSLSINTGVLVETFEGRLGNDTMIGATFDQDSGVEGNFRVNYAKYQRADEAVSINLSQATGADLLTGSGGTLVVDDGYGTQDTLVNVNGIIGTRFDDALVGDQFRNVFRGLGGNDFIDGGDGIDTVSYTDSLHDVTVDLDLQLGSDGTGFYNNAANGGMGQSVDIGEDTLLNIENVVGSNFGDNILGDAASNTIWGQGGDDLLDSRDGGNDTLYGGSGDDVYIIKAGDVVSEFLADGVTDAGGDDLVFAYVSYTAGNGIENVWLKGGGNNNATGNSLANELRGNAGNNKLTGGGGNDSIEGGQGNDTISGGGGNDWASYDHAGSGVTVNLSVVNIGQNTGGAGTDFFVGGANATENLKGSRFGDFLTGTGTANAINGGAGNDSIFGGNGNDVLTGGAGRDEFIFNVTPSATTNSDTITDFRPGTDKIVLFTSAFPALAGPSGPLDGAKFKASIGGNALDADDRILYSTSLGKLYYDPDGNGATARVQFATLSSVNSLFPAVTAADFSVGNPV